MRTPAGLRAAEDVVPRLGVKAGVPALRLGAVAAYDRPLEHLAGQLDIAAMRFPIRSAPARYGVILAFALDRVDVGLLARELPRVAHPLARIWIAVWKKDQLADDAPSWDEVQRAMLATGWVDNKILSFGDEVYGTQYVLRKERRTS